MRAVLAALALALAAPAAAPPGAWHRVDSPHFIVVGGVDARDLRAIAVKFEAFREALHRVLPDGVTSAPVPTVVVVFPDDEAFTPFKPLYQGRTKTVLAGYATAGLDVNYIAMVNAAGEAGDRTIFHEYTHVMVANAVTRPPVWLNEGLAEFYSTFTLTDGGARGQIGRPVFEHLRRLAGRLRVPLADLLKVGVASPLYNEEDRVSDFYAESWALTHMLVSAEPSRVPQLADYLRRVNEGASEAQAWEDVFGTARTEDELRRYLRRPTYTTLLVDMPARVTALQTTDTALSPADAAAFEAALLLRHRGADVAAALLEPALAREPANALANAAMAQVEIARRQIADAERRLLALERTDDWFTAYETGLALAEAVDAASVNQSAARTRAAALLDQVSQSHGELPNTLAWLARLELSGDTSPSPAARANIARARTLAPGRIDYTLTEAELLASAGDFAGARAIVGPLMTPAYPENVRNAARRLMAGLVAIEQTPRTPDSR